MRDVWTPRRLAACFADRLSLPNLKEICVALYAPDVPVAKDPTIALTGLLAGTAALLAGVPLEDIADFLAGREDITAAAADALGKPGEGWVYQHERGTVTITVHFPASFMTYLHIIASRIREELNAQAA